MEAESASISCNKVLANLDSYMFCSLTLHLTTVTAGRDLDESSSWLAWSTLPELLARSCCVMEADSRGHGALACNPCLILHVWSTLEPSQSKMPLQASSAFLASTSWKPMSSRRSNKKRSAASHGDSGGSDHKPLQINANHMRIVFLVPRLTAASESVECAILAA